MRRLVSLIVLALTVACVSPRPKPPQPPPAPFDAQQASATCSAIWPENCSTTVAEPPTVNALCVDGFRKSTLEGEPRLEAARALVRSTPECVKARTPLARKGIVRASNHVLLDDNGPHNFIGTTWFWALWAFEHDRPRFDRTVDCLAGLLPTEPECPPPGAVEVARTFAAVGGPGNNFWKDRAIDPTAPGHATRLAGMIDALYAKGIRTEVTIFGGIEFVKTAAARRQVVESVARVVADRPEKVFSVEVVNEGWQSDIWGLSKVSEARDLAKLLQSRIRNLVSVTAPEGDSCEEQQRWSGGGVGTLTPLHFRRSWKGDSKQWEPPQQPWRESRQSCQGVAPAYSSQEPIGIDSSVQADADVMRRGSLTSTTLVGAVAVDFVHTGTGIRGWHDPATPATFRPADFWQVKGLGAQFRAVKAVRDLLPADIGNWARGSSKPSQFSVSTFPELKKGIAGTIDRLYCASKGADTWCAGFNLRKPTKLTPPRAMRFRVYSAETAALLHDQTVAKGQAFTLPAPARKDVYGKADGTAIVLHARNQ